MPFSLARFLISSLCMVSFFVQTLGGSNGAARILCIGCSQGGWTITATGECDKDAGCCEDEAEAVQIPQDFDHPVVQGEKHCHCIAVALVEGLTATADSSRVSLSQDVVKVADAATMHLQLPSALSDCRGGMWSRAGPPHPPRLLTPMSRCTVLVI